MDWSIQLIFEATLQELQLLRLPSLHPGSIDVYEDGATLKIRTEDHDDVGGGKPYEGPDKIEEAEVQPDKEAAVKQSDEGHGPAGEDRNCTHIKEKPRAVPEADRRYFYGPEMRGGVESLNERSNVYLAANLIVYVFVYSEVFAAYDRLKLYEGASHAKAYKEMTAGLPITSQVQE